jgi:hypothetical protein
MADGLLSQSDADALLHMEKERANGDSVAFPDLGGRIEVPLVSRDGRESFSLDINRKRIALTTGYQTRGRQTIVLARLDFAAPHRNPDATEIGVPHLHLYREGYGDRWAYSVPEGMLSAPSDARRVLHDFMVYCRVVVVPDITFGLFA